MDFFKLLHKVIFVFGRDCNRRERERESLKGKNVILGFGKCFSLNWNPFCCDGGDVMRCCCFRWRHLEREKQLLVPKMFNVYPMSLATTVCAKLSYLVR